MVKGDNVQGENKKNKEVRSNVEEMTERGRRPAER